METFGLWAGATRPQPRPPRRDPLARPLSSSPLSLNPQCRQGDGGWGGLEGVEEAVAHGSCVTRVRFCNGNTSRRAKEGQPMMARELSKLPASLKGADASSAGNTDLTDLGSRCRCRARPRAPPMAPRLPLNDHDFEQAQSPDCFGFASEGRRGARLETRMVSSIG